MTQLKYKARKKAFTLVELIIVITILAILATIAFMSFQWYTKKSRDSNRLATVNQIEKGIELYSLKTGKVPTPENITKIGTMDGEEIMYAWEIGENISRQIGFSKVPIDPLTQNNYLYGIDLYNKNFQVATFIEEQNFTHNIFVPKTYAYGNMFTKVNGNYK